MKTVRYSSLSLASRVALWWLKALAAQALYYTASDVSFPSHSLDIAIIATPISADIMIDFALCDDNIIKIINNHAHDKPIYSPQQAASAAAESYVARRPQRAAQMCVTDLPCVYIHNCTKRVQPSILNAYQNMLYLCSDSKIMLDSLGFKHACSICKQVGRLYLAPIINRFSTGTARQKSNDRSTDLLHGRSHSFINKISWIRKIDDGRMTVAFRV